ncbi:hypothetical protein LQE93_16275 [Clostridium sp. NSJ-145]|uniref:hypothetical protein n=1 Tax=Clostridium sp. NSJ-145 TaxID=2897777 RepID=UPI001E564307|nr:hypothetical protein [Clostridium sp. NSJ-145]MCD2503293.1 hypothetical protein [Clostridium sp. NSJ-145]
MYNYIVYGLKIKSDIKIKEFIKSENENNDIDIVLGQAPDDIKSMISKGSRSSYSKTNVWFHIDNIATYYITNGKTILVEPCENHDETLLRVYLMCSCLGFIMLQREQVAIHGGVINIDGNAVIFTGDRGTGKSTLTTALRNKGYQFISDDVAATYFDKVPYVYPGFPYQKLCDDAMDSLGYEREGLSTIVGEDKVKYIVPAFDSFYDKSAPLTSIVKLEVGDVDKVTIDKVIGQEKLMLIMKNVYRQEFLGFMGGMTPVFIKKCVDIAKNITCYKVTRPKEGFTVNEQINLIEDTFINIEEKAI